MDTFGPPGAGALAFRRSTAASEALTPRLGSSQRFLEFTGCEREDPLRHQCSEHLAVRHWAGRADAQAARGCRVTSPARGNRPRPINRLSPVDVPSMGEIGGM